MSHRDEALTMGMREAIAFSEDSYPFCHQVAACLSEHVGHIDALLRADGHRVALGEVFLEWPDSVPPTSVTMPSCLRVELSLRWRCGNTLRPGLNIEVLRSGEESVSACAGHRLCGPEHQRARIASRSRCLTSRRDCSVAV